jgi:hypothetical protein
MTLAGYQDAGGVRRSIATTADDVYERLSAERQAIARSVFLRLTELGEGTEDTRRRVRLDELVPQTEAGTDVESVLNLMADKRLVTMDEGSAEVAHEALIREWPRLRAWLDEDREGLRFPHHHPRRAQQLASLIIMAGTNPPLLGIDFLINLQYTVYAPSVQGRFTTNSQLPLFSDTRKSYPTKRLGAHVTSLLAHRCLCRFASLLFIAGSSC